MDRVQGEARHGQGVLPSRGDLGDWIRFEGRSLSLLLQPPVYSFNAALLLRNPYKLTQPRRELMGAQETPGNRNETRREREDGDSDANRRGSKWPDGDGDGGRRRSTGAGRARARLPPDTSGSGLPSQAAVHARS
jgi:hypothetical protein